MTVTYLPPPPPLDVLSGTVCQLTPGTLPWGPGYYLVAANTRVEAGPFASPGAAREAARWLHDNAMGVHPAPWEPRYSATGLLIGSRIRDRRKEALAVAQ